MKTIFLLSLGIIFSLSFSNEKLTSRGSFSKQENLKIEENYPDSSLYWLNESYLKCLELNKSVCDCLAENEWVILYVDTNNLKLIIGSSVHHFGLEQSENAELIKISFGRFKIKNWRVEDSVYLTLKNNKIEIRGFKNVNFIPKKLKTLDIPETPKGIFTQDLDLLEQLGKIHSRSILKYLENNDDAFAKELIELIYADKVSVNCSDDYFYNSMYIERENNKYFHLEYQSEKLIFYDEEEGRGRFEKIDTSNMERHVFYFDKK